MKAPLLIPLYLMEEYDASKKIAQDHLFKYSVQKDDVIKWWGTMQFCKIILSGNPICQSYRSQGNGIGKNNIYRATRWKGRGELLEKK